MKKRWVILLMLGVISLLPSCVQNAFYYPDNVNYGTPNEAGLAYQSVEFKSKDGVILHGWFVPAKGFDNPEDALGTVIHFHGNAQNMSAHWHGIKKNLVLKPTQTLLITKNSRNW